MSALIIYESMFGNTRKVAEAIAAGIGVHLEVTLVRAADAPTTIPDVALLVVGAPTHVHGLSSEATRDQASQWVHEPERHLTLEPGVLHHGVREWLADVVPPVRNFATFDTRADISRVLSGSAAMHIDKALRRLDGHAAVEPTSFLEHDNQLLDGELARAQEWGEKLARLTVTTVP